MKFDDLVDWYCQMPDRPATDKKAKDPEDCERQRARGLRAKLNADQLVADVFTELGIARAPHGRRRMH